MYVSEGKTSPSTWIDDYHSLGYNALQLYAVSMYWTVTTITTVGYGDISGTNSLEMFFCSVIMLVGVIALFRLMQAGYEQVPDQSTDSTREICATDRARDAISSLFDDAAGFVRLLVFIVESTIHHHCCWGDMIFVGGDVDMKWSL